MKAIVIEQYGGKEELVEREVPAPEINDNQVLVELYATSINPIDWKVRAGYLKDMLSLTFPVILGWDAAGIVRDIGDKVTDFQVGDEVFARPDLANGTYAEYVAIDDHLLAKKPDSISFQEAAAVPLAGLTAWQCLVDFSGIQSGDKVLIQAGAGGVGSLGIQIAKSFGAYVISTASGKNEAFLKELGVDEFINYEQTDFADVVQDADIVLDTLGGGILEKSYDVLKAGGHLVSIAGEPDQKRAEANQLKAGFLWLEPNGKQLAELGKLMEKGQMQPTISHTFPLSQESLREAHRLSETHHTKGKIIITMK